MNERACLPASPFDEFVASRPDEERWELIDGGFVLQASPDIDQQIIAMTLVRLLSDALPHAGIARIALPGPTIAPSPVISGSKDVPDVTVLDMDAVVPDRPTTTRCDLAIEMVSASTIADASIVEAARGSRSSVTATPDCRIARPSSSSCRSAMRSVSAA